MNSFRKQYEKKSKNKHSVHRGSTHGIPDSMATMPTPAELMDQELHINDTMVPNIIATNAICFTIACIAVVLRFQARRMARVRYAADDWLIVVGLVRRTPLSLRLWSL